jgi:short-subunit dehydrogenase
MNAASSLPRDRDGRVALVTGAGQGIGRAMAGYAARHLGKRKGAIINIASTRAIQSEPNLSERDHDTIDPGRLCPRRE